MSNNRQKTPILGRAVREIVIIALFCALSIFLSCSESSTVVVESEPEGAAVFLDGEFAGQTPVDIEISSDIKLVRIAFGVDSASSESTSRRGQDRKTLTAAYLPLTANLPLFVALDRGYFERNGVRVNAIEATSPNDIITGIVSGNVDFAAVLAYSILFPAAIRYPGEFKLYSSSEETASRFTSSIIAKVDSPIRTWNDLRGKKIGVYTGLVQINFLRAILAGMGISESEVKIVQISPRLQIQGLVSEEYDALSSTEPTTNIARLQGIAKVIAENPRVRYIMNPFPSTAATISTKLIEDDPESAQAVVMALNMAVDFIRVNPEEAKKSMLNYTAIPKDIASEVLADLKLFKYCKLGEENRLNVQRFADFLFEAGILKERIPDVNVLFGDYDNLSEP